GDEPSDPAADIALTEREEGWLRGFLESPQVPLTTLTLEALDGLFCALVVGLHALCLGRRRAGGGTGLRRRGAAALRPGPLHPLLERDRPADCRWRGP